jgi:serine/threonine protein kinase
VLTPEPGTVVGGKHRILHALGEGGMGTVYAAENLLTLKRMAIKWLHPRLIAVQEASQRLLHEARATARIRHRNVVDIYDVVLEGESVFLVMELLLGEQLSTFLAREQLTIHEVIALLLPAMRGVAAAHAAGVVHRDIKPDNILLAREAGSSDLVPTVIDFGISRVFEADGARLTRSGMTMGTPRYVSYEQRGSVFAGISVDV